MSSVFTEYFYEGMFQVPTSLICVFGDNHVFFGEIFMQHSQYKDEHTGFFHEPIPHFMHPQAFTNLFQDYWTQRALSDLCITERHYDSRAIAHIPSSLLREPEWSKDTHMSNYYIACILMRVIGQSVTTSLWTCFILIHDASAGMPDKRKFKPFGRLLLFVWSPFFGRQGTLLFTEKF